MSAAARGAPGVLLGAAIFACGCGGQAAPSPQPTAPAPSAAIAEPPVTVAAKDSGAPMKLKITSQPEGKTYHAIATAWFGADAAAATGMQFEVEPSGISIDNIKRVNTRQHDVGFATIAALYEGLHGVGWAKGETYANVRILLPAKRSVLQMAALEKSAIKNLKGLNGKKVNLGPEGSTPNFVWAGVFDALKIKPKETIGAPFGDVAKVLADGSVDASADLDTAPHKKWVELDAQAKMRVLGLTSEETKAAVARLPYLVPYDIAAKTYPRQSEVLHELGIWNVAIVHKDVDKDVVRKIVSVLLDRAAQLQIKDGHGDYLKLEHVTELKMPLHAGLAAYVTEKGGALDKTQVPEAP